MKKCKHENPMAILNHDEVCPPPQPPHSPLPWKARGKRYGKIDIYLQYEDGSVSGLVCQVIGNLQEQEANASFIVEACNNYEKLQQTNADLVKALEKIGKNWFDPNENNRGVCGSCDGGLHGFADGRPEYHDDDCPYEIAHKALRRAGA